ncbi:hypothetical protein FGL98_21460 [Leekyejoonella antrihumi]|uniref:Uncharacterized protein n=2 Tax=Leekyejoonella antrihumi TaxID=1660198 RepID=A0A563DU34_9MICO|nr:hypothetical protein FGL98_21460 [Leekyejoonella antrihumi]
MAVGALVLILLVVWAIAHVGDGGGSGGSASGRSLVPTTSVTSSQAADQGGTVAYDRLPTQAHHTLDLIAAGGPFPYPHDGIVYQNRERMLPKEANGYYHEYTVDTPGSSDRGARRIIKARDGTLYYTDDHYRSFRRIVQ